MPTIFPNLGITLPTRGPSGSGHWADTDDANWAKVDQHDHSPSNGARIPTAGIGINADLSFSSQWAVTALNRATFASVAPPAVNKSIFVGDGTGGTTANELYWTTNTGNNVKITAGNSLNVAGFAGGIGGDFTAVGAALTYDDANKRYKFLQGGGANWARIQSGPVRISELGTSEAVFVEQACPTALAGSYTMTWPTALPGSTVLAQIDATGQHIWSNTVPNPVTFSSAVTLTGGIANNVTLTSGATAAIGQHIAVQGAGLFKHGTKTLVVHGSAFSSSSNVTSIGLSVSASADPVCTAPIVLPTGARILAVRMFCQDSVTGPTKITTRLYSLSSTGVSTTIASSAQSSGAGTNQTLTISPAATTVAASTGYAVGVSTNNTGTCSVWFVEVDYDQP